MEPAAHSPGGPQKRLTPASPNVETDKRARGSRVGRPPGGPELMASKSADQPVQIASFEARAVTTTGERVGRSVRARLESSPFRLRPGAKGLHGPLGGLDGLGVVAEERLGRLAPTVPNLYGVAGFVKTVARIRRPVLAF